MYHFLTQEHSQINATSPDGHTQNQIDHMLINKRWRGIMQDAGALRGTDIGSDQTLVLARMKLRKIKRNGKVGHPSGNEQTQMKSFR